MISVPSYVKSSPATFVDWLTNVIIWPNVYGFVNVPGLGISGVPSAVTVPKTVQIHMGSRCPLCHCTVETAARRYHAEYHAKIHVIVD